MDARATAGTWETTELGSDQLSLSYGVASDPGMVRSLNEDGWLAAAPVFLIADGMGGHASGDLASAMVTEHFSGLGDRTPLNPATIASEIEACAQDITTLGAERTPAPGTTLVLAALISEGGRPYWLIANVGDSRAYLITGDEVQPISHDHSVVQELIDAGQLDAEGAAHHPERHVVTRALGGGSDSRPDFSMVPVPAASRLVLCSDGVTSELSGPRFAELASGEAEPLDVAQQLVRAALDHGGRDNATALVVDVMADAGESVSVCDDTVPGPRSGP